MGGLRAEAKGKALKVANIYINLKTIDYAKQ